MASLTPNVHISAFEATSHLAEVVALYNSTLDKYPISKTKLEDLLCRPNGYHLVALEDDTVVGFCALYVTDTSGSVALLLVDPLHQRSGIGSYLLSRGKGLLQGNSAVKTIGICSNFPRFFPGIPTDLPSSAFFLKHGPPLGLNPGVSRSRDLHISLPGYKTPIEIASRANIAGLTFTPCTTALWPTCIAAQHAFFSTFAGWPSAYQILHDTNRLHEIMVALDANQNQVGWCLTVSPGSPLHENYAYVTMDDESTGIVACVGVDPERRKGGAGLAMVGAAVANLRDKSIKRCFIDWVVLKGWYEKLGFETWREYY